MDVSLLDSALSMVDVQLAEFYTLGMAHGPTAIVIRCQDGYVVINPVRPHQWVKVFQAMGREDLANDREFVSRANSKEQFRARQKPLREWAKERPMAEVMSIMNEADVPNGPVNDIERVFKDPHLWERNTMVAVEPAPGARNKMLVPGEVVKLPRVPCQPVRAPSLGEHNEEIYGGLLGLSEEAISGLKEAGVV
ncbi:MAG: CoA transferase [Chloroflexi bacterium]|nr:CoA transferase [Chloroflexota bacterium]